MPRGAVGLSQARALSRQNTLSKYGNRKVKTEDGTFDSLHEYERWCELKLLQRAGEIRDLERQKKFVLIPSQKDDCGKVIERECYYVADFVYHVIDKDGCWNTIVEDAKGFRTEVFRIKKKLMLYMQGVVIKEV